MVHFCKFVLVNISFLISVAAWAAPVKIQTVSEVLEKVTSTPLVYRGKKLLSGYYSMKSCIYTNDEVVFVVNYCEAPKDFSTRSVTIIDRHGGLIQFYDEKLPTYQHMAVRLSLFNGELKGLLNSDTSLVTLNEVNDVYKQLANMGPSCWSLGDGRDDCYKYDASVLTDWFKDSRLYIENSLLWEQVLTSIWSE